MSISIEDAQFVANTRLKIVQNQAKGVAPETGIEKDDLKKVLESVRHDRSIGDAGNSKAKGKAPTIPIDLKSFMGKK